ncbi:MAG: hypothetical protein KDD61_06230 [Bdellovibrionales bacterium]|nr:hypothetical protein [Bdellovibrionales bacterium]
MSVKIESVSGRELEDWLDRLAELRIEVFREYPYLYEGDIDYEREYLQTYVKSARSHIVLVLDDTKLVGASTAIHIMDESEEFKSPFIKNHYDLSNIVYFGESIIKKEYRGQGLGRRFFELRETFSKQILSDLKWTTFCAVERECNHPLQPEGYKNLHGLWEKMGYKRIDQLKTQYRWKDIDKDIEDAKNMVFWTKPWS